MEWLNQNGIGASEELLEPSDRRPAQNGTDPTCKKGRQRRGTALRAPCAQHALRQILLRRALGGRRGTSPPFPPSEQKQPHP